MAKLKIKNPALDGYEHNLLSPVYNINGNSIDFRTANAKVIAAVAQNPNFKRLWVKPDAGKGKPKKESGKK